MIRQIASEVCAGVETAVIASRFPASICAAILAVCSKLHEETGIQHVAFSGGVQMNTLLADRVEQNLTSRGFSALRHHRVPPNDGAKLGPDRDRSQSPLTRAGDWERVTKCV
jgi:hydrogenase maturation protein HypF